jgi:DnaK suppressor protein
VAGGDDAGRSADAPRSRAKAAKAVKTSTTAPAPAPAKARAKPKAAGSTPSDRWLAKQQHALVNERSTYVQQADELKAEADQLAAEMEPGDTQFDDESGEGATSQLDRERDLALSAQARAAVEEIDRALAKIDDGSYGRCERCGKSIPKPRLEAIPWAALCVQCKSGGLSARR